MLALRQLVTILIALLYVVSPVDAIPDFLPGIGWLAHQKLLAIQQAYEILQSKRR
jgi:uncharacterized membrane protein YkvA (DUF1232 family)